MIRRHKKAAVLLFLAWLAFGLWQPVIGADVMTALLGLCGLRLVAGGYRRVYRWVSQ